MHQAKAPEQAHNKTVVEMMISQRISSVKIMIQKIMEEIIPYL
jgi:hypothetical protein